MIPGALAGRGHKLHDKRLPRPKSLFVFSFYDAPNPDSFFAQLYSWLNDKPFDELAPTPSYEHLRYRLRQAGRCLIVMDGLEKAQDDGARGGVFGQLNDGRLHDLITRVAGGMLPMTSVIITSRFPIASLEEERPPNYVVVPVEELSDKAGVSLLRKRGVVGSDAELTEIVQDCGNHALTIDLAGGYLAEFGEGDPTTTLKLGSEAELQVAANRELDPRRRAVRRQEIRFTRITERYQSMLARRDPAILALLQRVCLFRLGVDTQTLARIFIGKGRGDACVELARLNRQQLQQRLDLLVEMRLLEASRSPEEMSPSGRTVQARTLYNVHPAVRQGFLRGLGGKDLNQDFHFGPGTVKVYPRAAPNTTSFRAEPCT